MIQAAHQRSAQLKEPVELIRRPGARQIVVMRIIVWKGRGNVQGHAPRDVRAGRDVVRHALREVIAAEARRVSTLLRVIAGGPVHIWNSANVDPRQVQRRQHRQQLQSRRQCRP